MLRGLVVLSPLCVGVSLKDVFVSWSNRLNRVEPAPAIVNTAEYLEICRLLPSLFIMYSPAEVRARETNIHLCMRSIGSFLNSFRAPDDPTSSLEAISALMSIVEPRGALLDVVLSVQGPRIRHTGPGHAVELAIMSSGTHRGPLGHTEFFSIVFARAVDAGMPWLWEVLLGRGTGVSVLDTVHKAVLVAGMSGGGRNFNLREISAAELYFATRRMPRRWTTEDVTEEDEEILRQAEMVPMEIAPTSKYACMRFRNISECRRLLRRFSEIAGVVAGFNADPQETLKKPFSADALKIMYGTIHNIFNVRAAQPEFVPFELEFQSFQPGMPPLNFELFILGKNFFRLFDKAVGHGWPLIPRLLRAETEIDLEREFQFFHVHGDDAVKLARDAEVSNMTEVFLAVSYEHLTDLASFEKALYNVAGLTMFDCCVCYDEDIPKSALVEVCDNKHSVCQGCFLDILNHAGTGARAPACPLCRETIISNKWLFIEALDETQQLSDVSP